MGTRRPDGRTTGESSEFRLETLEPRLLFSADLPFAALGPLADGALAPAVAPLDTAAGLARDVAEGADGVAAAASSPNELVIVYADVPDLERLLADLAREGGAARDIVVLAASDGDGTSADAALARLGAALEGRENLTAVHLISHGADGALALGGVTVDTLDLLANADAVAGWGDAFADGADLLLYGCDVAASADGRAFVDTLAALSGADVAASDDVTGAAAAGGDWRLEYARGSISHDVATGAALRDDFAGTLATTYRVSSLADVPPGDPGYADTLRWALEQAVSGDDIAFDVAGTISLQSALPPIAVTVTIDATTVPGYAGSPLVVLDGAAAGAGADGLFFGVGSNASTLRGLAIVNFDGNGLVLEAASGHVVQANHIGTDGIRAMGNGGDGIRVTLSSGNLLGGPDRSDGNVVSGNDGNGIVLADLFSSSNEIQNNLIGTDAAGDLALGNGGDGIALYNGSHDNRIGGTAGFGNVVSGNSGDGILISAPDADGNVIGDNLVGLAADGTTALGNARHGIVLYQGPQGNLIGTDGIDGAPNVVSSNGDDGIVIDGAGGTDTKDNLVAGNLVGTDAGGTLARGNGTSGIALFAGARENTIGGTGVRANVISDNGHGGVYIGGAGTDGNHVLGNRIGTDMQGVTGLGNTYSGVGIDDGASGNVVGGDAGAGMGNLISGNGDYGVYLGTGASGNTVQGNRIGTDADGLSAIANLDGGVALIDGAHDNALGGSRALGLGNLISGNDEYGVLLTGADTSGNVVAGNLIGTDASGAAALGNGSDGVLIGSGANDNTIGGLVASEANTISANGANGVYIGGTGSDANRVVGNRVGTTLAGDGALANTFSGVVADKGARDTEIGGARATGAGNLISGNARHGVHVDGGATSGTRVQGNLIGTDASGTARLGNGFDGVHVERAAGTRIGGAEGDTGNVISSNGGDGVRVGGVGAVGTVIEGNRIGTDRDGVLALGNGGAGVRVEDGAEATRVGTAAAGNVVSGNGGQGIVVDGGGAVATRGNLVENNLVGTDADGTAPLGNVGGGIVVTGGAIDTRVGGLAGLGQGNVVAAGTAVVGIRVDGVDTSGTRVSGNLVGTDRTGDVALANLVGIEIRDTVGTVVGGGIDGQGNVVSGNLDVGVHVLGTASVGVHVVGNLIGTTANGTGPLGNGSHGVLVGSGARQTTIGGAAAAQRNVVSANGGHGIAIAGARDTRVDGNVVGTSADGTVDLGNDGNGQ